MLATVILLLLVAKDASLNKATRQLQDLAAATTTPPFSPPDPDAPVDDILVPGGGAETDAPVLGDPSRNEDGRDGSQTRDPADVPDSDPDASDPAPTPATEPARPRDSTAQSPVPDTTTETEASPEPAPFESGKTTPGRLVGFDPCWRRDSDLGRRYYYAYDVTFERGADNGRFLITPHGDLQAGIPIIDDALTGDLRVLLAYPRQSMTFQEFREFGRVVESALAPKRQERPDYTENCLLAVTLDGDAPGRVAEFVRVAVGLYPITR